MQNSVLSHFEKQKKESIFCYDSSWTHEISFRSFHEKRKSEFCYVSLRNNSEIHLHPIVLLNKKAIGFLKWIISKQYVNAIGSFRNKKKGIETLLRIMAKQKVIKFLYMKRMLIFLQNGKQMLKSFTFSFSLFILSFSLGCTISCDFVSFRFKKMTVSRSTAFKEISSLF